MIPEMLNIFTFDCVTMEINGELEITEMKNEWSRNSPFL
jgi:hypothetical protein